MLFCYSFLGLVFSRFVFSILVGVVLVRPLGVCPGGLFLGFRERLLTAFLVYLVQIFLI